MSFWWMVDKVSRRTFTHALKMHTWWQIMEMSLQSSLILTRGTDHSFLQQYQGDPDVPTNVVPLQMTTPPWNCMDFLHLPSYIQMILWSLMLNCEITAQDCGLNTICSVWTCVGGAASSSGRSSRRGRSCCQGCRSASSERTCLPSPGQQIISLLA